jgi:hypothetical protein
MAEITTLRQRPERRGLVISTPELGVPDPAVVAQLERFAVEDPDVTFQPLSAIAGLTNSFFVDGQVVTVALPLQPAVSLGDRARAVDALRLRTADVASMLPAADARPADWEDRLRASLTTGIDSRSATALLDGVSSELDALRSAVEPPDAFPLTFSGRRAPIPLRITNSSPTPLTVIVHVESDKLLFPQNDVSVTLAPNTSTAIQIAAEARSNGVFPVRVELRTPAGNQLAEPIVLTARVNTLTGLGRVVTIGLLMVLATWWLTYFRRRRRAALDAGLEASTGRHPTNTRIGERSPDAPRAGGQLN